MAIVKLLPHQYDLLTATEKYVGLIGGVGLGKTFTLANYIISRVAKYPYALHFVGANTYSQLKNSTVSAIIKELDKYEMSFSYNQTSGELRFLNGLVLCKSMENFNALRGIEIGTFALDEARDMQREAFDMLMGRLRDKNVKNNLQGRIFTTPKGYNWIFDYFHPNGEFNNKNFRYITASSYKNKYLPDGYIESLKDQYSEKYFEQEVLGEFVNLTSGKVYYSFNRDNVVKEFNKPRHGSTLIGQDFNVGFMASVIGHIENDTLFISDELFLLDSSTYETGKRLIDNGHAGAMIYPDSTGANRKTSGRSDFAILESYGFTINPTRNPLVFDRVNLINVLLRDKKIIIHPRCKRLITDLEKVSWKGTDLDQTTDRSLTHISDALGYLAWATMNTFKSKTSRVEII